MDIFNNFSIERFLTSLPYMWKGMLCIFIVIAVIILSVVVMNFFSAKAQERKAIEESDENTQT